MSFMDFLTAIAPERSANKNKDGKVQLYTHDYHQAALAGLLGGAALSVYQLWAVWARRNHYPNSELLDRQESLHLDTVIQQSFVQLQVYRNVDVFYFSTALHNIDRLLFLEDVLVRKEVFPSQDDAVIATEYYTIAKQRLNALQKLIKKEKGIKHYMVANTLINKIFGQVHRHFQNVLRMCSSFNVQDLLAYANQQITMDPESRDGAKSRPHAQH